ncbi:hypothetical protein LUZ60_000772 [Juncus effusus]|nr:hypothetical protein LUZ60_000772 [Juncus effusus]
MASRPGDIKKAEKLLQGARLGDHRMVKVCVKNLDRGKGIKATIASVKDSKGEGALHLAAREGKLEILQYLIENLGFNPDLKPSSSRREEAPHGYKLYSDKTPLLCATLGGHVDTIEYLIKKGARDENGFTPIHTAVFESQVQSLFTLASKGAPIDRLHFIGTPILLAAARNNPNMIKILLDHKADPEMKYKEMIYKEYITPLVISVLNGSKECAELLVKAGANVNACVRNGS